MFSVHHSLWWKPRQSLWEFSSRWKPETHLLSYSPKRSPRLSPDYEGTENMFYFLSNNSNQRVEGLIPVSDSVNLLNLRSTLFLIVIFKIEFSMWKMFL